MRSYTTRLFILVAAMLIVVIVSVQVHWMNKTYKFEQNEFNTSVLKAVRGVYEDLPLLYNSSLMLDSLVEKKGANSFLFQVHHLPSMDSLVYYISSELEDFRVFTDCRVAVFDQGKQRYVFEKYISADASRNGEHKLQPVPLFKKNYNYVHLYFPGRKDYIISQMGNWIVASFLILLLLVGFAFSVYYLYRQKFLFEVQKDFINNVTHEFSTPLSVIGISADGLKKPGVMQRPDRYTRYAESIIYQTDYLKKHISNLVRAVVAGNYHFAVDKKLIVPNQLIRDVINQVDLLLSNVNGHVILDLEPGEKTVPADKENLYLAIFNVVNNAIKYSVHPEIKIMTWVEEKNYYISIADNGIGIEAAERKKIFKKFYRVNKGDVHNNKGLGLGLYFTWKVIKGHHGHIDVRSVPGKGSEFIIQLPLNDM